MSWRLRPELVIVVAQCLLTGTLLLGFIALSYVVLAGRAMISGDLLRLADTLFGGLVAMCTQAISFWFARQRPQTPADPPEAR